MSADHRSALLHRYIGPVGRIDPWVAEPQLWQGRLQAAESILAEDADIAGSRKSSSSTARTCLA